MFVLNQRHVLGICDRIIERGYDLNIWAYARIDTIKDGMLDKLKAAGFNWLAFGIEAGDDGVLRRRGQGVRPGATCYRVDRQDAGGRDQRHRQLHLRPARGRPRRRMQATLDLALDLNCEFANFYSAMAYPGSPLYAPAVARRACRCRTTLDGLLAALARLPAAADAAPAGRRGAAFRDEAFQKYFTHPPYLEMIERKFGAGTLEHIREMTAHRLERKYAAGGAAPA